VGPHFGGPHRRRTRLDRLFRYYFNDLRAINTDNRSRNSRGTIKLKLYDEVTGAKLTFQNSPFVQNRYYIYARACLLRVQHLPSRTR